MLKKMSEAQIQAQIVQLLQLNKIWCHSVPNELAGGGRGAKVRTSNFVATGLKKGVGDLAVFWKHGVGYVEVKTPIGRQSDAQKRFEKRCIDNNITYDLVRSVADVEKLIKKYI